VLKASSRYLSDIREDLESGLERLLECSSQRLSKLEEMTPRDIRELRKALGLLPRYLEIKHSNPRLH
jgi:DNA-binding transcriptional regulator YiaG